MKIARAEDSAEIFFSVQGEGRSVGRPSVFVRASLCNLHCVWCDTDYTWNWKGTSFQHQRDSEPGYGKFDKREQIVEMSPEEVVDEVLQFDCRNVVLTGGEPLLQQDDLVTVMQELRRHDVDYWFETETNGTIRPSEKFDELINQYNVSPKTSNSNNSIDQRIKPDVLGFFAGSDKATFKFVVANPGDLDEIDELVGTYGISPSCVYLMPEGTDSETLQSRHAWVIEQCKQRGFHFSDRLHIHVFGNKRGV